MEEMQPGDVVGGRFLIEREVRSGGMAAIYRAADQGTGEAVALKVLHAWQVTEADRFGEEAHLLASFTHHGIVRYIAHGEMPSGELYLAMEWLDGEDLSERLSRSGLTLAESITLVRGAAEALSEAHQRDIVHRDIKPSNLFLQGGSVERVKLLDFGIARLSDARRRFTQTGMIMGTPGYIAPEQARGAQADARADVFALGAVLFECLTGKPAFLGQHVMTLLAKLLLQDAPRVRELCADMPPALDDLVARMLSKDPAARPPDAMAIVEALRALDAQLDVVVRAPPRSVRPPALTDREQRLVCVIVATALDEPPRGAPPAPPTTGLRQRIDAMVRPFGAHVDALVNGSVLATLIGVGNAREQAARAARCALALRSLLPGWQVALVMGREISGQLPVDDVLDRAATLLELRAASARRDEPAPVRLDEATRALIDVWFDVVEAPGGWALLGEREIEPGMRPLLGKPTPCLGRERELRTLNSMIDACVGEGMAQAVLVTAPAGVGKSRLRSELLRQLQQRRPEVEVWIGQADPMGAGSAFSIVGAALRHAAEITGAESIAARREKLAARLARSLGDEASARAAEFLGEIVGAFFPDARSPRLRTARQNEHVMADQIRRAWEDFVAAECEAHPLLLVLEDLHWGDAPSVRLVDAALRRCSALPLVVIAFARPEVHDLFPKLWIERQVHQIRLADLPRKVAEQLVRYALGDGVAEPKIAEVVDRAAGNAFYLEELIRAVAEGRGEKLPDTVLAMVEARLAALDAGSRRVLRAASILGETFWRGGVMALLGGDQSTDPVRRELDALVERELVTRLDESRFPDDEEFAFRHALLREGAYGMLTDDDRVLGHKLAAEWLVQAGETEPAVLAEHFERGGEPGRAADFYVRAAQQAFRADDGAGVMVYAEKGLLCGAQGEARAELLVAKGKVFGWSGRHADAITLFAEAAQLSAPGRAAWCAAIGAMILNASVLGRPDVMHEATAHLLEVEPEPNAVGELVRAHVLTAEAFFVMVHYPRTRAHVARIEQLGAAYGAEDLVIAGWTSYARALVARHLEWDLWSASQLDKAAVASFEAAGDRRYGNYAKARLGLDLLLLGAYEVAEARLREVIQDNIDGEQFVSSLGQKFLAMMLIFRHASDEDLREAEALLTPRDEESLIMRALTQWLLALLHVERRDLVAAEREARIGAEVIATTPHERLRSLSVLGKVLLEQGRLEEALDCVRRSEQLHEAFGIAEEMDAYSRVVHIEVLEAAGQKERARALLRASWEGFLERANRIDDPEVRKCHLERVRAHARLAELARALG